MSTHATIAMKAADGSYRAIYCHSDGYPTHVGRILLSHYATNERITALLELGNISVLGERLVPDAEQAHSYNPATNELRRQPGVTMAYGRDFGNDDEEASAFSDDWALREGAGNMGARYLYVFDNGWRVAQRHGFTYGPYVPMTEPVCQRDELYTQAA